MYPRFLQIILGIETNDQTHRPINKLTAKLFASMQSKYNGVHRPLLPAMLPGVNAAADEGNAGGGQEPLIPDAAGANAPVDADEGPSVAPDASASVAIDAQPPPSPRPSTPRPTTPPPSPDFVAPDEHVSSFDETIRSPEVEKPVEPEASNFDQPFASPQITRLATPSPMRPAFEDSENMDAGFHDSPLKTNDAPDTTCIPASGAEGPVTLTSMSILLNRCLQKIDDLDKDLKLPRRHLEKLS